MLTTFAENPGRKIGLHSAPSASIEEMEIRGYIFAPHFRDFVLYEQWNTRHGMYTPMDRGRGERFYRAERIVRVQKPRLD